MLMTKERRPAIRTCAAGRSRCCRMGDSAGGGLALGLLLKLRDNGMQVPRAAVALSPWTDLALTGASMLSNGAADPMLNADDLPEFVRCYLAGADPMIALCFPTVRRYGRTAAGLDPGRQR